MVQIKITKGERDEILKETIAQNLRHKTQPRLIEPVGWSNGKASLFMTQLTGYQIEMKREPELFDDDIISSRDQAIRGELEKTEITYNLGNEPYYLSFSLCRLMLALSKYVTTHSAEDEEQRAAMSKWTEQKEDFGTKFRAPMPPGVKIIIPLKELAREIYQRTTQEKIEAIYNGIMQLRDIYYNINSQKDGGTYYTKILSVEGGFKDNIAGRFNDYICIAFSPVFFWDINRRYAQIPENAFKVLKKNGGTLLMALFSRSISLYYCFIAAARKARNLAEKENVGAEEEERRVKEALTWKFQINDILKSINVDYTSRRQYRNKLKDDASKALQALKDMEIITEGELEINKKKQLQRIVLVFNEHNNRPKLD